MKQLLTTLVILSGLLGSAGDVWADAQSDFDKGKAAYQSGDFATALKEWKPLADQGNAKAQFKLGTMYFGGKGVTQDFAEAMIWYRKAADQGHAGAQSSLGQMYEDGKGVTKDYGEAVKWYRKAAEQGQVNAQSDLGFMYYSGKGVTQDYAEAAKWNRKAADQGYAGAQTSLGQMYEDGKGVTKDRAEAVKWYRKAAEQGYAWGQTELGSMYYNGRGVTQDYAEAVKWLRKAAEQGNAYAKDALKKAESALQAQKEMTARVSEVKRLAEQGDADAQNDLGEFFEEGVGVTQDYAEAMKWYRKAAEQGSVDAEDALERVAAKMSELVLRDFLIRSDVQDLETLAKTIESKCNKKPKCAFDKVWNYIDKTGDRKLSLAEISRFQRNLIKLAAHKKGGDLKLQEILGLNLTTILFAPITASSILHSFDYNNDDYLSKKEVFGDTEFAKLVGIDQNSLSSLANFDEISEQLSKYMKKLPF